MSAKGEGPHMWGSTRANGAYGRRVVPRLTRSVSEAAA
jgi:hypothetical protein